MSNDHTVQFEFCISKFMLRGFSESWISDICLHHDEYCLELHTMWIIFLSQKYIAVLHTAASLCLIYVASFYLKVSRHHFGQPQTQTLAKAPSNHCCPSSLFFVGRIACSGTLLWHAPQLRLCSMSLRATPSSYGLVERPSTYDNNLVPPTHTHALDSPTDLCAHLNHLRTSLSMLTIHCTDDSLHRPDRSKYALLPCGCGVMPLQYLCPFPHPK